MRALYVYNIEAVSSCRLFFFPIFPIRILTVDFILGGFVPDWIVFLIIVGCWVVLFYILSCFGGLYF